MHVLPSPFFFDQYRDHWVLKLVSVDVDWGVVVPHPHVKYDILGGVGIVIVEPVQFVGDTDLHDLSDKLAI